MNGELMRSGMMEKRQEKVTLLKDLEGLGEVFAKKLSNSRLVAGD